MKFYRQTSSDALTALLHAFGICCGAVGRVLQSLLEACVTDTGAIDFGRSGATGLAKQVSSALQRNNSVVVVFHDGCVATNGVKRHPRSGQTETLTG